MSNSLPWLARLRPFIAALYLGALIGVSFVATPAKFLAELPLASHLEVGRATFSVFQGIELGLVVALFVRPDLSVTVGKVRNPVFVTMSDGSIRNTYDVRLRNKHGEERPFKLTLAGDPALQVQIEDNDGDTVNVAADTAQLTRVYIVASGGTGPASTDVTPVRIWVEDLQSGERAFKDTTFNGQGN